MWTEGRGCLGRQEGQPSIEHRGRHRRLLAQGDASGMRNLNADIAGATHSLTKVVTVMLIVIVEGVLLFTWVGGRV